MEFLDTRTAITAFKENKFLDTKTLCIYKPRKISFDLLKIKRTLLKGFTNKNKLIIFNNKATLIIDIKNYPGLNILKKNYNLYKIILKNNYNKR